eukprot:9332206-Pyramimonas_sp.AAC.1
MDNLEFEANEKEELKRIHEQLQGLKMTFTSKSEEVKEWLTKASKVRADIDKRMAMKRRRTETGEVASADAAAPA